MTKPQLSIQIDSQLAQLNRYLEETGTSKTEIVQSAIANCFGCTATLLLSQRIEALELKIAKLKSY